MPTHVLRNIDAELWTRFRARAAQEGRSKDAVLLGLMQAFASGIEADSDWMPIESHDGRSEEVLLYFPPNPRQLQGAMLKVDSYPVHIPRQPTLWRPIVLPSESQVLRSTLPPKPEPE